MQLQIYKQIHQIYAAIKFAMETAADWPWDDCRLRAPKFP